MQSQVRRGAGRIKYGMRSLYRILSEYGNARYTWQVMVSGYYVVCTYTVQCVLHENTRLLYLPFPLSVTLSGVFATNSGIAPHARSALPCPLAPSKRIRHSWCTTAIASTARCRRNFTSLTAIMPRDGKLSVEVLVGGEVLEECDHNGNHYVEMDLQHATSYDCDYEDETPHGLERSTWPVTPFQVRVQNDHP